MFRRLAFVRLPLFWGGLAFFGFYGLIHRGVLSGGMVERYFTSHPVEYVSTGLFFVGMAALMIQAVEVLVQYADLNRSTLEPMPDEGVEAVEAETMLASLARLPARTQHGYLVRRLREALEFVRRKRTADTLDDQLRHLADADVDRMYSKYALVRIVVWAIPILGFLGTVIGITLAIANLSPEALENSLPEVTAGLGVAFDTTALALALSIVLMFSKFFIERSEGRLLAQVDARVSSELVGRFRDFGAAADPNVAVVRRMAESVVQATEKLVERQAELWQRSMDAAQGQWHRMTRDTADQIEASLASALQQGLERHAAAITNSATTLADENRQHMSEIGRTFASSAQAVASQQAELVHQAEVLCQVVEATGQVRQLEAALNDNLSALAGSRNFEETVMSLAAAIQLLRARLGDGGND
ncbi:MAG: MotA/TolQ/ExbB proton channel family protein, partial [Pirellulales bacterium]